MTTNKVNRGRFITVEGVEGAGKSTHLQFVRDLLASNGIEVVTTREPGGTPLGESLRELLLMHSSDAMCIDAELLLMFAARAEHLNKVIIPALETGKWVLCDRFSDATYAYQGGGRGISIARIKTLEKLVLGKLRPHMTLILDVPLEIAMSRVSARGKKDRFEEEDRAFFQRIRDAYKRLAETYPERCMRIDTSASISETQSRLRQVLVQYMDAANHEYV